jgi:integrase
MPRPRKPGSIHDRFERYADKTFGEAAARYLAEFDGKDSSKTRAAHALYAVNPYIGHLALIDVDDEAMQQYKEDRKLGRSPFKKPAMVGTIGKELTQVTTVLSKACRVWRWLPSVPLLQHPKGPRRVAYQFNHEEQDRLFRELPTGWDTGAALFAVNTGVRKEEMFGLKWTDRQWLPELDIKNADGTVKERMYVFVLSDTKNGQQRAVVCNSLARRAVEAQRKYQAAKGWSEYVFPSRWVGNMGGKVRATAKAWTDAWKRAGLPMGPYVKRGIHCCRHVFAYRLRAAGVPQEDRNALLGHANTSLATHYAPADIGRLLAYSELVTERKGGTVLRVVS